MAPKEIGSLRLKHLLNHQIQLGPNSNVLGGRGAFFFYKCSGL